MKTDAAPLEGDGYDPFEPGPLRVRVADSTLLDETRRRVFPYTTWSPLGTQRGPLVVYSHSSGGDRRSATFLCEHLASHGYTVVALDHSERVAADKPEELTDRIAWLIANRVPDVRLPVRTLGADRDVGLLGHSFGGWTVLAAAEVDHSVASVVALAPAGNSRPRTGIIPVRLTYTRLRSVPTLILAGDRDASTPLDGVLEIVEHTPDPKRLVVLRGVDHLHFVDDVASAHEAMRAMRSVPELSWAAEMEPLEALRPPGEAHRLVRGLTLAHFDASLRERSEAERLLASAELGAGI